MRSTRMFHCLIWSAELQIQIVIRSAVLRSREETTRGILFFFINENITSCRQSKPSFYWY